MRIVILFVSFCVLAVMSCGNSNNAAPAGEVAKRVLLPVHSKLNDKDTRQLMTVVTAYYGLKNALVASKATRADSAAYLLTIAADTLRLSLVNDSTEMTSLKPYFDTIIGYSKSLKEINDPSCERQRLLFGSISGSMYSLLKNVELSNARVYHEYCPMAFNEKGATWLSEEAEIKNPYFGKKMLECGEVTDSLK